MKHPGKEDPCALVKRSRLVHRGRIFSCLVEDITLPNGVDAEMTYVDHPGSIAVVPVMDDGRVVLTRQYRHPVREYLLEIPAGTLEPGELPLECAKRELEEETGLLAGSWKEMGRIHLLPAYSNEIVHLFVAEGLTQGMMDPDADEIIESLVFPADEVLEMIRSGIITDALTIAALQRFFSEGSFPDKEE